MYQFPNRTSTDDLNQRFFLPCRRRNNHRPNWLDHSRMSIIRRSLRRRTISASNKDDNYSLRMLFQSWSHRREVSTIIYLLLWHTHPPSQFSYSHLPDGQLTKDFFVWIAFRNWLGGHLHSNDKNIWRLENDKKRINLLKVLLIWYPLHRPNEKGGLLAT